MTIPRYVTIYARPIKVARDLLPGLPNPKMTISNCIVSNWQYILLQTFWEYNLPCCTSSIGMSWYTLYTIPFFFSMMTSLNDDVTNCSYCRLKIGQIYLAIVQYFDTAWNRMDADKCERQCEGRCQYLDTRHLKLNYLIKMLSSVIYSWCLCLYLTIWTKLLRYNVFHRGKVQTGLVALQLEISNAQSGNMN